MSRNYVEGQIQKALKKSGGNRKLAQRQIIAQCFEDPELLQGLTKAHLTGIVAYNIERVLSGRSSAAAEIKKRVKEAPSDDNFGMEVLKAIAGNNGAMFGMDAVAPPRKTRVSQGHIDAINAMTKGRRD